MIYSGAYGSAAYGGIPAIIRKQSGRASVILMTTNTPIALTSRAH